MTHKELRREGGLGSMFGLSLMAHLATLFLFTHLSLFPGLGQHEAPVYYVDVVNLPVAHPQAGSPSGSAGAAGTAASPAPHPAPSPEMNLPAKPQEKGARKTPPPKAPSTKGQQETAREFEKRLSQLQENADARHEAAALDAIRKGVAGRGGAPRGMPGGTGSEAGSDYGSYIQSRLKDAFKTTIATQSKNPEVVIRLTLGGNGRIVRSVVERSSGDRVFEDAVMRAIAKAEPTFPPPPTGRAFEQGFVFRPQGVQGVKKN